MENIHVLHGVCLIWEKWIKRQGPILLLLQVQVLNQRKLKNLLWDWFVQKEYHFYNTNECMRKITNENTSQKFNMKTTGSSTTALNEFQMKNI